VLLLRLIKKEAILKNQLQITLQNRKNLYDVLTQTPKSDLLKIPEGFRNNIWWNIAHVVVTDEEIKIIADFLISTIEWTKADYEAGLFKNFNEYTTSAKVTLRNVQDAADFNLFHEGIHLGSIFALKKML